jgi:hypothetical protein
MRIGRLHKFAVTVATVTALAATQLLSAATASARDGHYGYRGDRPGYGRPDFRRHEPRPYPREHRRDRTGDAVVGTIIGIGALIVGAAIADAARKQRHYDRDYD